MRELTERSSRLHLQPIVSLICSTAFILGVPCAISGCSDDRSQIGSIENPSDPQVKHKGSMDYFVKNKAKQAATPPKKH